LKGNGRINLDTIAAIGTPIGYGGIGIIRISGKQAFAIAEKIYKRKKRLDRKIQNKEIYDVEKLTSHKLYLGYIIDKDNNKVFDEVLMVKMNSPHSYTGEDIVEIQAHASAFGLEKILSLVLKAGSRLADPGEFTKRAFLNGRIDLTQAEAVMDLIHAKSDKALQLANNHLSGAIGEDVKKISKNLLEILSKIEAEIDFSEEQDLNLPDESIQDEIMKKVICPLEEINNGFAAGILLREGIKIAIVGKPNVGKSSLLNTLLKKERSIVTEFPGTTRDTIEETVSIKGLSLKLIDTAGIHFSEDFVEKIGMERTKRAAAEADLIIFMVDADAGISIEDENIYQTIKEKPVIIVINKIDIESNKGNRLRLLEHWKNYPNIRTSIKFGMGLNELEEKIYISGGSLIGEFESEKMPNLRQKEMIENSLNSSREAIRGIEEKKPEELVAIDLKEALESLNIVTGKSVKIDVLDEIFSRFCIGK
jgi:tRNA modification GTPase